MSRKLKIVEDFAGIVSPPPIDFSPAPTRNRRAGWNSRAELVRGTSEPENEKQRKFIHHLAPSGVKLTKPALSRAERLTHALPHAYARTCAHVAVSPLTPSSLPENRRHPSRARALRGKLSKLPSTGCVRFAGLAGRPASRSVAPPLAAA